MALGSSHNTTTTAANYIPQLWSDEIIATFKANIVLANLVTRFPMTGKKGSVINVPNFTRGSASAKAASTQVTLVTATHGTTSITIDKHYEYSVVIEDIVAVQALDTLRAAYTDDAAYALAKQIDTNLVQLGRTANGGSTVAYGNAYIGGDGTTAYTSGTPNNTSLTDAAIRRTIQRFDDADYPLTERNLVVPPSQRNVLMGISRFTEQAFVGNGDTIRTGKIGDIYGIPVFVSTNCDTATGSARICLMFHRSWAALAMQQEVRTQTQYKQEYLGDLFTADVLYGVAELRDAGAIPLAV